MILEFVTESRDNLDQFDQGLISLEATPDLPGLLESIFRTIHTIKGSCGLIGFTKLESITHSGENLLDKLQQGKLTPTAEVMNALHDLSDAIRRIFTCVSNQGNEGDLDVSALIEVMEKLQEQKPSTAKNGNDAKTASLFERMGGQEAVDTMVNLFYTKVLQDERISHFFENVDLNYLLNKQKQFLAFAFGGPSDFDGKGLQEIHKHLVEEKSLNESHFDAFIENLGGALMELKVPGDMIGEAARIVRSAKNDVLNLTTAAPEMVVAPTEESSVAPENGKQPANKEEQVKKPPATGAAKKSDRKLEDSSIRVDVQLLDKLMNLVGELVLARNQILQFTEAQEEATQPRKDAIKAAGFEPGKDVALALDVAASEFFEDGKYTFEGQAKTSAEMIAYYEGLIAKYPLVSIEDPLDEEDWDGWAEFTKKLGEKIQIVGDDLFVTNPKRLAKGIETKAANALLVKVNQIGSLSETIDAVELAHRNGYRCMMSHRSGETEDTTIADLAVALSTGQIKSGAPARGERIAKYNQLLRIEEELGDSAEYAGASAFPRFQA